MRRSLALILALAILAACLSIVSCANDSEIPEYEFAGIYKFNPYDNLFKPSPDMGKEISVSGKTYYFKDMDIRDKNAEKQVTAEQSLETFYVAMRVYFHDEKTVEIIDYGKDFDVPPTEGKRIGNILLLKATNKTNDYTYDIRIEIHPTEIWVIHNAHTYNKEGMYSLINYVEESYLTSDSDD
jgi:hypothetical protein